MHSDHEIGCWQVDVPMSLKTLWASCYCNSPLEAIDAGCMAHMKKNMLGEVFLHQFSQNIVSVS